MKILLPFKIKDIGGTATFAIKFRDSLSAKGHVVFDRFRRDFDVLFIIADCPLWLPIYAKLAGKKVVQRLDGVYHRATPAGSLYPLYNLKMWCIHRFLADTIIYQSQFSQRSCTLFLGKTRAKYTAIIYNGVDIDNMLARNPFTAGQPVKLITFAKFRRRDQIEPILESVKLLDPKSFTLDIYGSYTENLRPLFQDLPPQIRFMGKRENGAVLKLLSDYDIFLFSDQSACPNSVLEAMAAGLPTVAFERGSIPELIESGYNGKIVPVRKGSDPFTDDYPFTEACFRDYAKEILSISMNVDIYSSNARSRAESLFKIDHMINYYLDIISTN